MENNFRHQEFEEFLQEQLRNHRMYPNDTSWTNINKKLHGDRKWPALTIGAIAIFSVTLFIIFYFSPQPNIFAILPNTPKYIAQVSVNDKNIIAHDIANNSLADNKSAAKIVSSRSVSNHRNTSTSISLEIQTKSANPNPSLPSEIYQRTISKPSFSPTATVSQNQNSLAENAPIEASANVVFESPTSKLVFESPASINTHEIIQNKSINTFKSLAKENFSKNEINKHTNFTLIQSFKANAIERAKNKKLALQLYFAPSISYRKLFEEKSGKDENTDGPVALNYVADVNTVVRHKPGTGFEAGLSFLYSLTNKFRLKSGVQFNMRQYSIEAYRSSTELASIALENGQDTINSIAIYRTGNGFYSTDLINRYFQLSLPLGVEWQIAGNKKIQWNIAGTIQPTYLLNRNAYLISTNFKNYTESPDMVRKWNLNTNIETFVSFNSGGFKWQVGPQVRYQPYSTFISQYLIKENLLDYGLKVGISTGF